MSELNNIITGREFLQSLAKADIIPEKGVTHININAAADLDEVEINITKILDHEEAQRLSKVLGSLALKKEYE